MKREIKMTILMMMVLKEVEAAVAVKDLNNQEKNNLKKNLLEMNLQLLKQLNNLLQSIVRQ